VIGTCYEDNFGFYYLDDPEERDFFAFIIASSEWRRCERCEQRVKLLPTRHKCASCEAAIEFGAGVSYDKED
jgi:hypothetical protein